MGKLNKKLTIKILAILLAILITIVVLRYLPKIIEISLSLDKFSEYIYSMGYFGVIIFILFQVLQTVIAPIPGEVVQIAGGYIYGINLGTIYTTIGLIIGAGLAFYFTRLIGGNFIVNLLKNKSLNWMLNIMDSKKFDIILFIIFLVPGLPKDFMIYVAGLTTIKPLKFFTILILGRLPWIIASVSVGANISAGNYLITIIISIIAVIGFIVGMIYKDKVIQFFNKKHN